MFHRIELPSPIDYNGFYIYNGNCKKWLTDWRFNLPYETLMQLDEWGYETKTLPCLADILHLVGSHATLWLGDLIEGVVAPMDVEPLAWTYPNRQLAIAPEWFWLWYPSDNGQELLVQEANSFSDNPASLFEDRQTVLKSLVPFQLTCDRGQIQQIDAIPVTKLASIIRTNHRWVFQWQAKSERTSIK